MMIFKCVIKLLPLMLLVSCNFSVYEGVQIHHARLDAKIAKIKAESDADIAKIKAKSDATVRSVEFDWILDKKYYNGRYIPLYFKYLNTVNCKNDLYRQ